MTVTLSRLAPMFLAVTAFCVSANAQGCNDNDFKGSFSAIASGSFISPPPGVTAGPTGRVGLVRADGNGKISIKAAVSLAGFVVDEDYGGTYKINPDCTASFILQVPFPGAPAPVPFEFQGMLTNDGHNMTLILVSPEGTDVRIMLSRQRKTACNNGDLNGDYALSMGGVRLTGVFVPVGPFARTGKVSFDGAGGFKADVQSSYVGRNFHETFDGIYKVEPDCTFRASFTATVLTSWFGVLADTMPGANIIQTDVGTVISGNLTTVH